MCRAPCRSPCRCPCRWLCRGWAFSPLRIGGFGVSLAVSLDVSFSVSLPVSLSASGAPEGSGAQSRPTDGDASSACAGQISGAMFAALVRRVCPCSAVRRRWYLFEVQPFAAARVQRFGGLRRRVSVRVQRFGGLRRRDVQRFGGSVSVRVRFGG